MNACLLFGVRVFDEVEFWVGSNAGDFGNGYEIGDFFSLIFEVEAGISECGGEIDDGLANLMNLLLG